VTCGTQAQTLGELSNLDPCTQKTLCTHWQRPKQSVSPLLGSQLSVGSSAQRPVPGQSIPANPPQRTAGASATQLAIGGQGAWIHWTTVASQCVPAAQRTVAQGSSVTGGGLHLQVWQPSASRTLPY